jgi:hypothetical protein
VRLFHLPRPRTPEGVPSLVEVAESPHVPWRWGLVRGLERPPSRLEVDDEPLLMGQAVARLPTQEWALWGLPEWRRPVGPQGFQDVRLEEVLSWVQGACGGKAQIRARGRPSATTPCPAFPPGRPPSTP